MSRVELDAIQTKLKAAIQNHQKLVVKMKGDNQNAVFKKKLGDLQDEIKRLSEEQKKIVMKLRESLVKSTGQSRSVVVPPVMSVGQQQTITAIGQPRLVSFPTQGGTAILPVGMVAVPIAHMQRPAVGVVSQPASVSILPAGVISSGFNFNNISFGGATVNLSTSSLGLIQGSVVGTNGVNTTVVGSSVACTTPVTVTAVSSSGKESTTQTSTTGCLSSSSLISLSNLINNTEMAPSSESDITTTTTTSTSVEALHTSAATLSTCTAVTSTSPGLLVSAFPQQPLVQPQVLQQQQRQILQMIQQQQQQQQQQCPQQRLAAPLPIKVPQYTMSVNAKPAVSIASSQFCSIAPAPNSDVQSSAARPNISTLAVTTLPTVVKSTGKKEISATSKTSKEKSHGQQAQSKAESVKQRNQQKEQPKTTNGVSEPPPLSEEEKQKRNFMKNLDLYTPDDMRELMMKKHERKRRTTANPQYSIGFEVSQRGRNCGVWNTIPVKKPKVARPEKSSDSRSKQQSESKKFSDNHDDYCASCGKGGSLLMCETCRLVYHLDCLNPPLTEAPKYAWSCPKCLVSGRGLALLNGEALNRVHSYIANRAAKEDEKKKLQRKSIELASEKKFLNARSKELEVKMKEHTKEKERLSKKEDDVARSLENVSSFVKYCQEQNMHRVLQQSSS